MPLDMFLSTTLTNHLCNDEGSHYCDEGTYDENSADHGWTMMAGRQNLQLGLIFLTLKKFQS
jgi:hypothetical protein